MAGDIYGFPVLDYSLCLSKMNVPPLIKCDIALTTLAESTYQIGNVAYIIVLIHLCKELVEFCFWHNQTGPLKCSL